MSIVAKRDEVEFRSVSLRLPVPILERLDRYCGFVRRDRSEVTAALLEYALDRDEEFAVVEGREVPGRRRRAARRGGQSVAAG